MIGLKKEIGLITLISLGIGDMIGSGIFALPSAMAAISGPSLVLSIILAGIIILFFGMSYAELGSTFPLTGGPYSLPRMAMGDFGGFLMGWGYFINAFIGTAAIIDIFVVYLGYYFPSLSVGMTLTPMGMIVALIFLWLFTFINIFGVKWGGIYGIITTFGKIVPLIIFTLIGLTVLKTGNFTPFAPFGMGGITLAITLFIWAYTGFETVVIPAEEVKNPSRTIPLAMFLTILITIVIYTIIGFVFVGMVDLGGFSNGWQGLSSLSSPLAQIAKTAGLPLLALIVIIGATISTGGCGGNWVMMQGRMPYAMAKDNLFWSKMATVSKKYHTPVASLLFSSTLTSIIIVTIPHFPAVAIMAAITAIVTYSGAVLSVPILRKINKTKRPYKLPCMFLITLTGFIFATFLIYWGAWPWTLVGLLLVLSAYPVYFLLNNKKWEGKRNLWLLVYLVSIVIISFIGDPTFVSTHNFTNIVPLGLLKTPYDHIVLAILSVWIYFWGYKINTQKKYMQ
ncbi:MAG: amino acid permease [Chlamydiae bacterium]|nr:amino acid permease [Chlamydiota bacterium]